ncbi:MAG: deoxyguanosinetriphosphate triphosphohydrolase [[Clostridium] scindens]|uniref:deoxyguanosinetriphosphate triphosphohydrolase n=1 Tax=Clostridium scindens (strain JCM 10418 / VPI 12708) TaxID=29347 RepID=UPI00242D0053|nr:deoxyguanosinetriphosphate triphosphohydrolase [[Clostridium] scindens]MCI6395488.1 deoxyguanosinetriphosphate triphosphohydrolase [[Clostridium] scindens]MDY4867211.1 deoxyguanosinetriphosphate triphosphohydrolase [[Clostridium] scindens]
MTIREQLELREIEYLSPYATLSKDSRGRERAEEECDIRPVFQRDRDRILHSKAFRRLKQKTQVFLLPKGDHYRTRLTHTLEVSQNARTIAKALRLNEDLAEAIALGHDLGHTPFGHAGERALDEVCPLGFQHNEQSVRVVKRLEKQGEGLNLTWEVRDGILNHKSAGTPHTLEGQIVRLSDKIAYINHDIDDAIRGGVLKEEDIPKTYREILGNSTRVRLDTMIHNVIINSMDQPEIRMSPEVEQATMALRAFMFENVYKNPVAKGEEEKAINMVTNLYEYYWKHIRLLPDQFLEMLEEEGGTPERIVCDYIAGMTDTYAIKKFEEYFIPESWKI